MLDYSQNFYWTLHKVRPLFKHFFLDKSNTIMIILKSEDSARFKVPCRLSPKLIHSRHHVAAAARGHIQDTRTAETNNQNNHDCGGPLCCFSRTHEDSFQAFSPKCQKSQPLLVHASKCQGHVHLIPNCCTHPCNACLIKWVPYSLSITSNQP